MIARDMPKLIWATHHDTIGAVMIGSWADSILHAGGTEYTKTEDVVNEIAALRMEAEEAEMEVTILREIRSKLEAALRKIAFSDTQSFQIDVKVNGKSVDHEPRYVDEADVVRIVKIAGDALK